MNIFHAAGRPFAKGVSTPSGSLETMASVPFVIPTELAKQKKRRLKRL
jgi:hypothetical protein